MSHPRKRALGIAFLAITAIWTVVLAGYFVARNAKVTAEKVRTYAESVELSQLSASDRAAALRKLADMFNRLSFQERREIRMGPTIGDWFDQMTDAETAEFIEATMPTGMKQMLTAFEELPPERRQRAVDNAIKNIREARDRAAAAGPSGPRGTNVPAISPELEEKVREIGLKSYYGESSAQTKAELAPLLEELQRTMQTGGAMHGGRR